MTQAKVKLTEAQRAQRELDEMEEAGETQHISEFVADMKRRYPLVTEYLRKSEEADAGREALSQEGEG